MDWCISGGVCSVCTWPKQMECLGVRVGDIQFSIMRKGQSKARQVLIMHLIMVLVMVCHDLHWLPIDQRIEFKLATLTYNILNSSQPAYLRSLLNYHTPTRSLRSLNTNLLSVPRVHTTFASHDFSIAAPTVWISLPSSIRSSTSADAFRRLLKTHCFQQAYCSP